MSYFTYGDIPKKDFNLVKDQIEIRSEGEVTYYLRKDLDIDPTKFNYYLSDAPATYRQNRARLTTQIPAEESPVKNQALFVKRFHYHRTYRKKHRWFFGYRWNEAHGPLQFARALYAFNLGHNLAEPLLAASKKSEGLRQESLLVIKEIPGKCLSDYLKSSAPSLDKKITILEQAVQRINAMHEDKINFGDTKVRHLYWKEAENNIYFLDFDKLKINTTNFLRQVADFRRLIVTAYNKISQGGADLNWQQELWPLIEEETNLSSWPRKLLHFQLSRRLPRGNNK